MVSGSLCSQPSADSSLFSFSQSENISNLRSKYIENCKAIYIEFCKDKIYRVRSTYFIYKAKQKGSDIVTQTSKIILEKYQVRKSGKQKRDFRDYLKAVALNGGYEYKEEKSMGACNVVIGNPDTAKVVYTAHYDTCAVLPFPNFITPKNFLIYLLYQFLIVFALFGAISIVSFLLIKAPMIFIKNEEIQYEIAWLIFPLWQILLWVSVFWMVGLGMANKHTANDNTSGVTTLIDIMNALPDEQKNNVAFVFFDLEEVGLVGSMRFKAKHRKSMKNKLLINFDCVSDGENMLFAIKRKAKKYLPYMEEAFKDTESVKVNLATRGVFYPSDQASFPCGVGVAAMKKTKLLGIMYMNRIHTPRDTVYREENIAYLTQGSVKLVEILSKENQ